MNTPFARPPGRRKLLARFAPEWCALGLYALFFALAPYYTRLASTQWPLWTSVTGEEDVLLTGFVNAAAWTYPLAAMILFFGPLILTSLSWPFERARDTLEPMVLTSEDHSRIAWGRWWHIVLPWLRLVLWLAPIYLLLGAGTWVQMLIRDHHVWSISPDYWARPGSDFGVVFALAPKAIFGRICVAGTQTGADWSVLGVGLSLARMLRDGLSLMLTASLAYYVSVRRISGGRRLAATFLFIPFLMGTVFSVPEWAENYRAIFARGGNTFMGGGLTLYLGLSLAMVVAEVLIIRRAVGFVARNFDAWALGEKP